MFLDEIGNLPLHQQAKLLTVVQRRYVQRVGSNTPTTVDIRLVCATNKNLQKMVADGSFREDLLYRINTIQLELPPLRNRRDDIPLLADSFLKCYAKRYGKDICRFSQEAMEALKSNAWPGNIRQLRHAVEKAVIITDNAVIGSADLQLPVADATSAEPEITIEAMERKMICDAIARCGGNLSLVATRLGISRQTLYNKMKRYEIEP